MPTYFKANQGLQGYLTQVNTNLNDQSIWFRLTKQTGWNAEKKLGAFKGGETVAIKFNSAEVSGIINTVTNRTEPFSFYHTTVNGRFSFYELASQVEGKPPTRGFSLSFKKGDVQYKTSFTVNEACDLAAYLDHARRNLYVVLDAEDAERAATFSKRKAERQASASKPTGKLEVPSWDELGSGDQQESIETIF